MLRELIDDDMSILIEFIKACILVALPLFSWVYLRRKFECLSKVDFKARFGTLYQNVSPFKKSVYMYSTFFFLRRLAVAFSTTVWANTLILQIYTTVFGSLFVLMFYIEWRPMESTYENRLEVFNEGFTLFSNYFLIIFTDFVNVQERYDLGFVAIYLILAVCALNIASVLYNLILALKLKYM
jgi:hypothetical protein